jgi:AraC family transcriptional regulator of adaptative response/methylated-DNA-[protein]-cysteine methyltransferase
MIERMQTGDGSGLTMNYSFADTPHGAVLIVSTSKGIAHISFIESEAEGVKELQDSFPEATIRKKGDMLHKKAIRALNATGARPADVPLHLRGTDFQKAVWDALCLINPGETATYADIARHIKRERAVRAVGTAIGKNPIAILIPCHRVIRTDGSFGGYRWGRDRKAALLESEAFRIS